MHPLPFPGLFAELRNQRRLFIWKKPPREEKTEGKASLAREGLLGSASSRSPFNSASFAWMNRGGWRGFLHPLEALPGGARSCCPPGLLGACSAFANLFEKHFEISQETNFQRGTGHWDGSGPFIPALIKKDNPSCHGEDSLFLKEK